MQRLLLLLALSAGSAATQSVVPANFVRIRVAEPRGATVRAIWRPYVGAVGGPGAQQERIRSMFEHTNSPDSIRRWRDPAARDTFVVKTPTSFEVDMNGGPITIEVVGADSVRLEAWQVSDGPPGVRAWGSKFEISSEGQGPHVKRTS